MGQFIAASELPVLGSMEDEYKAGPRIAVLEFHQGWLAVVSDYNRLYIVVKNGKGLGPSLVWEENIKLKA